MATAGVLNFQKNVNMSGLDEDISTKFGGQMHHGHTEMIAGTLITYQQLQDGFQPTHIRSP